MIRTVRMSHPDVVLPVDVPDDPAVIAVHEEAGWTLDPPLEQSDPALAPVQVEVPDSPKPAAKPKPKTKPEPTSSDT